MKKRIGKLLRALYEGMVAALSLLTLVAVFLLCSCAHAPTP